MNSRLYRSPTDRALAGVAGGMAETYDLDPALVRIGWALLILFTGGLFLVVYILIALVVPLRPMSMPLWSAGGGGVGTMSLPYSPMTGSGPTDASQAPMPQGHVPLFVAKEKIAALKDQLTDAKLAQ